ncbi:3-ketoacyl-ACP reductase [Photobacterium iliopiscarium]|nr:3-ketoacyl-ACP reductase [Photobacterium iliopiscarium]MCF2245390.1 3-ketoacyl-ACP reductase [Photobacterium iliopiscarium]
MPYMAKFAFGLSMIMFVVGGVLALVAVYNHF